MSNEFVFEGFEPANTTPVPDVLFDELLDKLSSSELRLVLYIIRRTWGFKKTSDAISLSQFMNGITKKDGTVLDKGCGIADKATIIRSLKSLEKKGIIQSEKTNDPSGDKATTVYRIHFRAESTQEVVGISNHLPAEGSRNIQPPVVGISNHRSGRIQPQVVAESNQQETVIQQTDKQETVIQDESNAQSAGAIAPPAAPIENQQEKPKRTRTRKPKAEPINTEQQARIVSVFDTFDALARECYHDPDFSYDRSKAATEAITAFLAITPTPTVKKLEAHYRDLFKRPASKDGFLWRDNMSIAAVLRDYGRKPKASAVTETKPTGYTIDEERNNRNRARLAEEAAAIRAKRAANEQAQQLQKQQEVSYAVSR